MPVIPVFGRWGGGSAGQEQPVQQETVCQHTHKRAHTERSVHNRCTQIHPHAHTCTHTNIYTCIHAHIGMHAQ